MYMKRLTKFGMGSNFVYEIMDVNESLSAINHFDLNNVKENKKTPFLWRFFIK